MPENKNAQFRYQILDRCFSDTKHKYDIDTLLEKVNEYLYDVNGSNSTIKMRQLRDDINAIRKMLPQDVYLDALPLEGKTCYYRYTEPGFSIYKNDLSIEEVNNLRSTIQMLGKYRGLPSNGWLEEVLSNLELRFGIKANAENLVSFEQNDQLKGLEFLSEIIDYTINHQTMEINYVSANGNHHHHVLHPYYVKQYNGRWFLYGLDNKEDRVKVLALDRIQDITSSDVAFKKNTMIDFNTYFKNVVGVTVPNKDEEQLVKVVLKFSPGRFGYVTSKPIHSSQQVIDEDEHQISVEVYLTKEFEQQLFSFGPDVEVLSPLWFREPFGKKIEVCMKKYFPMQKECIGGVELCNENNNLRKNKI